MLILMSGLGGIAVALDRFKGRNHRAHHDARRLASENQELRLALSEVRATSHAALLTGDPVAHELIIERIDKTSPRLLEP